jgi:hypothetical protein
MFRVGLDALGPLIVAPDDPVIAIRCFSLRTNTFSLQLPVTATVSPADAPSSAVWTDWPGQATLKVAAWLAAPMPTTNASTKIVCNAKLFFITFPPVILLYIVNHYSRNFPYHSRP